MIFHPPQKLSDLAGWLGCSFEGPADHQVSGLNEIHVVKPGDLVFVDHPKYYHKALDSAATSILIDQKVKVPAGKALLVSDQPFRDFNRLIERFRPFVPAETQQAEDRQIGAGTVIQPHVFIGRGVKIGRNCVIQPHVFINDYTEIGDNVVIQAHSVIGSDAFYYKPFPSHHERLLSGGQVRLEDDVEIGAACTIDRGVTGTTIIGTGTKLDNQVQIGHDTVIGRHCLLAAQIGIAGCTVIEDEVTLWGQVGVTSGIRIGRKAVIYAQSGVSKSLEGGKSYFGSPAEETRSIYKKMAALSALPDYLQRQQNKR